MSEQGHGSDHEGRSASVNLINQLLSRELGKKSNVSLQILNALSLFLVIVGAIAKLPDKWNLPSELVVSVIVFAAVLTCVSLLNEVLDRLGKGLSLSIAAYPIVVGVIVYVAILSSQQSSLGAQIEIMSVKHELHVLSQDNSGHLIRTRYMKARERTNTLWETDLYSDGRILDTNQFRYRLWETDDDWGTPANGRVYSCAASQWLGGPKLLRVAINPPLLPGHHYKQTLTWTSKGAFADERSDYFAVNVSVPTREQVIVVNLENGRMFDTTEITCELVKSQGQVVSYGEIAQLPGQIEKNQYSIKWTIPKPDVGDRYYIEWQYTAPKQEPQTDG